VTVGSFDQCVQVFKTLPRQYASNTTTNHPAIVTPTEAEDSTGLHITQSSNVSPNPLHFPKCSHASSHISIDSRDLTSLVVITNPYLPPANPVQGQRNGIPTVPAKEEAQTRVSCQEEDSRREESTGQASSKGSSFLVALKWRHREVKGDSPANQCRERRTSIL